MKAQDVIIFSPILKTKEANDHTVVFKGGAKGMQAVGTAAG